MSRVPAAAAAAAAASSISAGPTAPTTAAATGTAATGTAATGTATDPAAAQPQAATGPAESAQRSTAGPPPPPATRQLFREFDWATHAPEMGAPSSQWPASLRAAVQLVLHAPVAYVLLLGPEHRVVYNDVFSSTIGQRHPAAFGRPAATVFPLLWPHMHPLIRQAYETHRGTVSQEANVSIVRNGFLEECVVSWAFWPVMSDDDDDGGGEQQRCLGVLSQPNDNSTRVFHERHERLAQDLVVRTSSANDAAEVCQTACSVLQEHNHDVTFALVYRLIAPQGSTVGGETAASPAPTSAPAGQAASAAAAPPQEAFALVASASLPAEYCATIALVPRTEAGSTTSHWPLFQAMDTHSPVLVHEPSHRSSGDDVVPVPLPGGQWPESPHVAVVLPVTFPPALRSLSSPMSSYVLVLGVNPRRHWDQQYMDDYVHLSHLLGNALTLVHRQQAIHQERMLDTVCHELRNPTHGIVSAAELLRQNLYKLRRLTSQGDASGTATNASPGASAIAALLDEQDDTLAAIETCVRHQIIVTDDVLDTSRIKEGKLAVHRVPFDVAVLFQSVLQMFAAELSKRAIACKMDISSTVPKGMRLRSDPKRIAQVLVNLVSNAIKFTAPCDVRCITILADVDPSDTVLYVIVRDTGIGMSPEAQQRLFRRFSQVHSVNVLDIDTADNGAGAAEGFGLGLHISRTMVQLLGGCISVRSELGKGSEFQIAIPCETIGDAEYERIVLAQQQHQALLQQQQDKVRAMARASSLGAMAVTPQATTTMSTSTSSASSTSTLASIEGGPVLLMTPPTSPPVAVTINASASGNGTSSATAHVQASATIDDSDPTPPRRSSAPATTSPSSSSSLLVSQPAPRKTLRILIVDDNPIIQQIMVGQLRNAKPFVAATETASDGADAVAKATQTPYDCVLMDIDMPIMDGLEATRRIRAMEEKTGRSDPAFIIAVSGYNDQKHREQAVSAGVSHYLLKPYDRKTLVQILDTRQDAVLKAAADPE